MAIALRGCWLGTIDALWLGESSMTFYRQSQRGGAAGRQPMTVLETKGAEFSGKVLKATRAIIVILITLFSQSIM